MTCFGRLTIVLVLVALALTGCASRPLIGTHQPAVVAAPEHCQAVFANWQSAAASEQRLDVQAYSPPGFPYLRVDRFLASFDLASLTPDQRQDWLAHAHAQALAGWQFEQQGRPASASPTLAELRACSTLALAKLVERPRLWAALQRVATVPDDYHTAAQVLGAYPLVAPIVRWRATVTMGELAERFDHYRPQFGWRRYGPEESSAKAIDFSRPYARDNLGIPVLTGAPLDALVRRHAPSFRIDTQDEHDLPGIPGRAPTGELKFQPTPVVFVQSGFTRVNGVILPQLTYVLWFPARPPEGLLDIYAGALDGFFWRVTLDHRGEALVYDTVHACGCYHQWLLVADGLRLRPSVDAEAEQLWLLGTVPDGIRAPELSLSAGDHQLVAVSGAVPRHGRLDSQTYRLDPLDQLRGASFDGARLYGADGLIAGTQRPERFLLWPTGVASAGAMRQWGHHAVSFVGRRHFDDPDLLDRYFRLP